MQTRNTYVDLLHRFMRHYGYCYAGATGRRCLEVIRGKYGHVRLFDEPGLPEARAPEVVVGIKKNDTGGMGTPIRQPLFPIYSNAIIDPGLVSRIPNSFVLQQCQRLLRVFVVCSPWPCSCKQASICTVK